MNLGDSGVFHPPNPAEPSSPWLLPSGPQNWLIDGFKLLAESLFFLPRFAFGRVGRTKWFLLMMIYPSVRQWCALHCVALHRPAFGLFGVYFHVSRLASLKGGVVWQREKREGSQSHGVEETIGLLRVPNKGLMNSNWSFVNCCVF